MLNLMIKIIQCESSFNSNAVGLAGEIGLAQFMPKTWELFNKERGTDFDIKNDLDQINMLAWGLENGKGKHWTCYRLLTSI